MKPLLILPALLLFASSSSGLAATVSLNGHQFTLPDGFAIERVAGPPLVDRPITADFDERGRLYVADSSGSNASVREQLEKKPHRIVRLEDTDGDGQFDKSTVFADRMMFPEGTLWHAGSLYVSAPPAIWKLTDTTGDGVADQRDIWYDAVSLTGCANDLHGPYPGPDGWIYWCKGAFAQQEHVRPDGTKFITKAAHIFRRHPDGGGVEAVMTGGMDNPVDVAFTPEGERIFTTTFFQHPGGGQRDGLVHAIYGGVYGKVHHVINDHPRTGEIMPVLTHLGPAAPCGLTRYESTVFGQDYQNNLFACLFNLHKVTRHTLQPKGATFQTLDEDFLVSDQVDFHPTDVLEDADGSLIVVDTGGWYKICCPTSQLYKPDVLGAIYRIRRTGAATVQDPRGRNIPWSESSPQDLAALLGDPRPRVQHQAMTQLAKRGDAALAELEKVLGSSQTIQAHQNALWTLMRMSSPGARTIARKGFQADEEQVRQVAAYAAGLWKDDAAGPLLQQSLTRSNPEQRAAAEALGRIGHQSAVDSLLDAAARMSDDRVLEHSLIFALIEIADPESTKQGLTSRSPRTQRVALIALDQMKGGTLHPEQMAPLMTSGDPLLQETAAWLIGRHPEWAGALTKFLIKRFQDPQLSAAERNELEQQLGAYAQEKPVQESLARWATHREGDLDLHLSALRAMAHANLETIPTGWAEALAAALETSDLALVRQAILSARQWTDAKPPHAGLNQALQKTGLDTRKPTELRIQSLAAVAGGLKSINDAAFELLLNHLQPAHPVAVRHDAALTLSKAYLHRAQRLALADALPGVGPLEIPVLLHAFDRNPDEEVSTKLLAVLKECGPRNGLRAEILQPHVEKFPPSLREQANDFLASLNVDAAQQKTHLDALMSELTNGDIRRGQAVFNSARAACSSCHAIGYLGGDIGPDLTRIGQIRTERDLLEAIVYPSASFVRSYEPVVVLAKTEEEYSGVLRQDAPNEVVLATGPGVEIRIPRIDIAEMRPGQASVMPGGLDEQLTRQELADLIAFLKATQW